jgi:hypothetical protein
MYTLQRSEKKFVDAPIAIVPLRFGGLSIGRQDFTPLL